MPTESGRTAKPDADPSYPSKWTGPKHITLHSLFGHTWPTINMQSQFTYTCHHIYYILYIINRSNTWHAFQHITYALHDYTTWKPLYHLFSKLDILVWRNISKVSHHEFSHKNYLFHKIFSKMKVHIFIKQSFSEHRVCHFIFIHTR